MKKLSLAYSSCPNDCFIFYAMSFNLLKEQNMSFDVNLKDIETLNQLAKHEKFDVTKLSFPAYFLLKNKYELLNSGSALGRGCGPLIIAKKKLSIQELQKAKIAVPGLLTTAVLLLSIYLNKSSLNLFPMSFEKIIPEVSKGTYDAGLIIHEGRFIYQNYNLEKIKDLGQYWEEETNLPIPLGCIAVKKNLEKSIKNEIGNLIKKSIEFSFQNKEAPKNYIKENAQELSEEVIKKHIDLYVNDFSISLKEEGEKAIDVLYEKSCFLS